MCLRSWSIYIKLVHVQTHQSRLKFKINLRLKLSTKANLLSFPACAFCFPSVKICPSLGQDRKQRALLRYKKKMNSRMMQHATATRNAVTSCGTVHNKQINNVAIQISNLVLIFNPFIYNVMHAKICLCT